ncbi:heat-inducible transcriptional repressor HrcA [Fructilactobacillus fructivorans]|uniref:heat-inducible transcriptional repressor HrcA n=1 Tax=Fructilactobacillus fructivorans TaxID=1614 RepID=UPI000705409F|nr:heat-inducible transcriptional repressor HrcA [Fructilactobacillus fructivorans]
MLTERQNMILKYIVDDYTDNGVPIGSKRLASQLPMNVSSATIRNEMAVLSGQNLIQKVHTSSGRVPSNEGYRYYIDNLVAPVLVDNEEKSLIHNALGGTFQQIDDIVKQSADILSSLTDYTAMTLSPEQTNTETLRHFQLIKLSDHQVMAIIIMNDGQVESQPFITNDQIDEDKLVQATNLVNDKLSGESIPEVLNELKTTIPEEIRDYLTSSENFVSAFEYVINKSLKDHFFVSGRMNLLDTMDDKKDIKNMKPLYSMFGDNSNMAQILDNDAKPISVMIGSELRNDLLKNYSIISGTYDVGVHGMGRIAVIGPTRMAYPKVLGLVDAFKDELQKRINGYYNNYDK